MQNRIDTFKPHVLEGGGLAFRATISAEIYSHLLQDVDARVDEIVQGSELAEAIASVSGFERVARTSFYVHSPTIEPLWLFAEFDFRISGIFALLLLVLID